MSLGRAVREVGALCPRRPPVSGGVRAHSYRIKAFPPAPPSHQLRLPTSSAFPASSMSELGTKLPSLVLF